MDDAAVTRKPATCAHCGHAGVPLALGHRRARWAVGNILGTLLDPLAFVWNAFPYYRMRRRQKSVRPRINESDQYVCADCGFPVAGAGETPATDQPNRSRAQDAMRVWLIAFGVMLLLGMLMLAGMYIILKII